MRAQDLVASIRRDGYVIAERLLTDPALRELTLAIAALEKGHPMGRSNFEGERTHRIYSLAGKGAHFMRLAEHPLVLEVLDQLLLPHFLLSNLQSIRIYPGETPQPWHTDDGFYPIARPRPLLAVSCIWALEDFTEANGATQLIPWSHLWSDEQPADDDSRRISAVMPKGSVLLFDSALWHRGGLNTSTGTRLAMSPQYCQPWLRPQESMLLIAPPPVAKAFSDRGRSLLGYSIHPPFLGQVDGMHPLRLVDPDYRLHKTHDRVVADQVLERPKALM